MGIRWKAASLLALCAQGAIAQTTTPSAPAPANASSPLAPPKPITPPSPFIQCDAHKGHAGTGDLIGQLVAITLTAGLAGDAFSKDAGDISLRLKGLDGVAACDQALAQESYPQRRSELALARTVHFIEAEQFEDALASVRAIPGLLGPFADDWGYRRSGALNARFLEAQILIRLNRLAEAEAVALNTVEAAPYDVMNMRRFLRFAQLTRNVTPAKRAYFDQLKRIETFYFRDSAEMHAWAGEYDAAADDVAAGTGLIASYVNQQNSQSLDAMQAVYRMMAGKVTQTAPFVADIKQRTDELVASGKVANDPGFVASIDELVAFHAIGEQLATGKATEARAAFNARTRWTYVPVPVVAEMMKRLRESVAAKDLSGALAQTPDAYIANSLATRTSAIIKAEDAVKKLYPQLFYAVNAGDFSRTSGMVWKVANKKPRFLIKPDPKNPRKFELLATGYSVPGLPAGEALLLHAALIARQRGVNSFTIGGYRPQIDNFAVLFGNIGQPGFSERLSLDAAKVIAAISPYIPEPVKK